jgi:osmoprotectant transport system ATP-binding protein
VIELKAVTKVYSGQTAPAVQNLTMTLPDGETCVLVGPSGCGKSTTLRLINRMIGITSGNILIDGKDINDSDPDKLRMGIGYVIQQIGLLPHRTVAENVAIVPRLYGWDKERIRVRVDQLLNLIGLDPEATRNKFPSQLSGGQMQRVGVARAMAVDPPIMLMDEPFGAVDPIARNKLQDEFLRLQQQMKKTICFVTHDINEAIKMGDRIAICNYGVLVQYGTPEEILTHPANDFVSDFIGHDRLVKKLSLFRLERICAPVRCTVSDSELPGVAQKMRDRQADVCFYLDASGAAAGLLTAADLKEGATPEHLKQLALSRKETLVQGSLALSDALSILLEYGAEYLGVLNGPEPVGTVSMAGIRNFSCKKEED